MNPKQRLLIVLLLAANLIVLGVLGVLLGRRLGVWPKVPAPSAPVVAEQFAAHTPSPTLLPIWTPTATPSTAAPNSTSTRDVPTATRSFTPTFKAPTATSSAMATRRAPTGNILATPPPKADPSWKYYENRGDGFALGVPSTWKTLDQSPDKLKQSLETLRTQEPTTAAELEAQTGPLLESGYEFFAYDASATPSSPPFLTHVSVVVESLAFPVSLDAYVGLSVNQLSKLKGLNAPVRYWRVLLAGEPAEEFQYQQQLADSNGEPYVINATEYVTLRGQDAYILTLTTPASQQDANASTLDGITASLHWLNP